MSAINETRGSSSSNEIRHALSSFGFWIRIRYASVRSRHNETIYIVHCNDERPDSHNITGDNNIIMKTRRKKTEGYTWCASSENDTRNINWTPIKLNKRHIFINLGRLDKVSSLLLLESDGWDLLVLFMSQNSASKYSRNVNLLGKIPRF